MKSQLVAVTEYGMLRLLNIAKNAALEHIA